MRVRRLSADGSVAYLVERPTREQGGKQYSDIVLLTVGAFLLPVIV